ncbi:hypothetical protein PPL_06518 [Heterostelium album PN500]|uniref:glycerol kinase n=1 Tax=Heterostelium pallidum (strain ATCC 26659 / Pp 5 / PN500) TaxID=670386 RepID=D3BDD5_HETP5|nr:hypothetical protein PPL_06518 [Heterostelium album PN500]EFA80579.1 hypothetical protein PPL_06518 [Heterostelium album PN500]|eukprot:XP_020432699.1 hypothetical protein PPL_06518 [Heterostelium album PN500]
MYVGIDLGTSAVKVVLINESGSLVDPAEWWQATDRAVQQLNYKHQLDQVVAIDLSGQKRGATLLDKNQKVLRPAILWNDGRCAQQCEELDSLRSRTSGSNSPVISPYNNPNANGIFFGLTLEHQRADLCKSVLEGVGFSLLDGIEVMHETGFTPTSGEVGPAIGAARLAMIALNKDKPIQQFLSELPLVKRHTPNQQTHEYYKQRRITFKQLYQQNLSLML